MHKYMVWWWVAAVGLLGTCLCAPSSWSLHVDTTKRHVFYNYTSQHCFEWDVIDETLTAFRVADGTVRMIAGNGHVGPVSMVGPSLLEMTRDCATGPVIRSRQNYSGPADYPHAMWLPATYTMDGTVVHGLVHDEFHAGPGSPSTVPASLCPSKDANHCWYSSVIAVKSMNGGRSFERVTTHEPNGIVIASPLPYKPDAGVQGVPAHRNIVQHPTDGYFYVMPQCTYLSQMHRKQGKCVWRTKDLEDPSSWRGWNGSHWSTLSIDPYRRHPTDLSPYTAAAVDIQLNGGLTYLRSVGLFVLLGTTKSTTPYGSIEYSWSHDLISWSKPVVLLSFNHTPGVRDGYTGLYPTMLDPNDPSMNFDRFGETGHLYFTEFDCPHTGVCLTRNSIRYPLRVVKE